MAFRGEPIRLLRAIVSVSDIEHEYHSIQVYCNDIQTGSHDVQGQYKSILFEFGGI